MSFRTVSVDANLECDVEGRRFSIHTSGDQTVVEVPDLATGFSLLRLGTTRGGRRRTLQSWINFLDRISHQVEVRIRGRTVGVMGRGVGRHASKHLGLSKLSLRPLALASVWISEYRSR